MHFPDQLPFKKLINQNVNENYYISFSDLSDYAFKSTKTHFLFVFLLQVLETVQMLYGLRWTDAAFSPCCPPGPPRPCRKTIAATQVSSWTSPL